MAEAERLRAQAERCKRFAFFITDQTTVRSLSDLAEESLSERRPRSKRRGAKERSSKCDAIYLTESDLQGFNNHR